MITMRRGRAAPPAGSRSSGWLPTRTAGP
jgi:hypothetical protein